MISNYLNIFYKLLKKNPVFSLLNVGGLSLGLCVSYIIAMYTVDELSYDQFHPLGDRMYRVGIQGVLSGNEFEEVNTCPPLAGAMTNEIPGVEQSIRLAQWPNFLIHQGSGTLNENNVLLADSNFFAFFNFDLLAGDPRSVLAGARKVVLTESTAKKYFGDIPYSQVVGSYLKVGTQKESYAVTGVARDAPKNSHIPFPMIVSIESWDFVERTQWTANGLYTYFLLKEEADPESVRKGLEGLTEKYVGPEIEQFIGLTLREFREQGGNYGFWLQPLTDIHLTSHFSGELQPNGDVHNVIIFAVVGIFVLIIAGINFVSLSTARATDRAKEIGIRKTFGALRHQLMSQHLFESFVFCLIAGIIAWIGVWAGLDYFNSIANKTYSIQDVFTPLNLTFYLAFVVLISLLSGLYPALLLSSYTPVAILRGRPPVRYTGGVNSRNLLVGFQFVLTTVAIILTVTVYRQLEMMRNKDLGFNKDQLVTIYNAHHLSNKKTYKQEIMKFPDVGYVNITQGYPPFVANNSVFRVKDTQEDHLFYFYYTDVDHFKTFEIELIEGRFFEDARLDSNSLVMNEAAFRLTGWDNIDGKQIVSFDGDETPSLNVIGVVKDFHFQDFKSSIQPLLIYCAEDYGRFITVRLKSDQLIASLDLLEGAWDEHSAGKPFDYSFVDTQFDNLFKQEKRLGKMTSILAIMTIITASLGLFGLATYVARRRRKEFSIRKVLGASVLRVMEIQIRYFLIICGSSMVVSIPVSYFFVNRWLDNFEYRIPNDLSMYVITILGLGIFIMATVGYQSYRASILSPTRVLRDE